MIAAAGTTLKMGIDEWSVMFASEGVLSSDFEHGGKVLERGGLRLRCRGSVTRRGAGLRDKSRCKVSVTVEITRVPDRLSRSDGMEQGLYSRAGGRCPFLVEETNVEEYCIHTRWIASILISGVLRTSPSITPWR